MTVEEMKSVDVRTVDRDSLVDVTQVRINEGMPKEERLKEFVRQVGNPYCFRVGSIVVKNVYSGDGVSLRERFEQFAKTLEVADVTGPGHCRKSAGHRAMSWKTCGIRGKVES